MDYSVYQENNMSFSKYLSKCFMWMFLGLLTSFGVSAIFSYTGLFAGILLNFGTSFILISSIIEIILVISLSRSVFNLDSKMALTLFFMYSVINGVTLSSIFYLFELSSIIYVFLGSSAIFGVMALVGYTTKLDLSRMGTFLSIALLSMLVISVIMLFSYNETAYLTLSVAAIGIFMLITTYDIHIIKRMYYNTNSSSEQNALAIYGALQLYLDFINIFLRLLYIFAKNRD